MGKPIKVSSAQLNTIMEALMKISHSGRKNITVGEIIQLIRNCCPSLVTLSASGMQHIPTIICMKIAQTPAIFNMIVMNRTPSHVQKKIRQTIERLNKSHPEWGALKKFLEAQKTVPAQYQIKPRGIKQIPFYVWDLLFTKQPTLWDAAKPDTHQPKKTGELKDAKILQQNAKTSQQEFDDIATAICLLKTIKNCYQITGGKPPKVAFVWKHIQ